MADKMPTTEERLEQAHALQARVESHPYPPCVSYLDIANLFTLIDELVAQNTAMRPIVEEVATAPTSRSSVQVIHTDGFPINREADWAHVPARFQQHAQAVLAKHLAEYEKVRYCGDCLRPLTSYEKAKGYKYCAKCTASGV